MVKRVLSIGLCLIIVISSLIVVYAGSSNKERNQIKEKISETETFKNKNYYRPCINEEKKLACENYLERSKLELKKEENKEELREKRENRDSNKKLFERKDKEISENDKVENRERIREHTPEINNQTENNNIASEKKQERSRVHTPENTEDNRVYEQKQERIREHVTEDKATFKENRNENCPYFDEYKNNREEGYGQNGRGRFNKDNKGVNNYKNRAERQENCSRACPRENCIREQN